MTAPIRLVPVAPIGITADAKPVYPWPSLKARALARIRPSVPETAGLLGISQGEVLAIGHGRVVPEDWEAVWARLGRRP